MHALDPEKYQVTPFYTTKQGVLYTARPCFKLKTTAISRRCSSSARRAAILRRSESEVWAVRAQPKKFGSNDLVRLDLAFPIVHGTNTEDGSIQGFFETLRLPYVGCDVASSALGMDKMAAKQVLAAAGLPVLQGVCFYHRDYLLDEQAHLERIEALGPYPIIVKPVNLGSSVGIKVASDRDALREAIDYASTLPRGFCASAP